MIGNYRSRDEVVGRGRAVDAAEGAERFEDFGDVGGAGAFEVRRDRGGGDGRAGGAHGGFDGADAGGKRIGPRRFAGCFFRRRLTDRQHQFRLTSDLWPLISGLIFGPQPADDALFLFAGALGIQRDDAFENLRVRQRRGPTAG